MLLSEIIKRTGFSKITDCEITNITDKLDEVVEGSLFVCIKGARFDGHSNAVTALQKGAKAFVVSRDTGCPNQIFFDNTREGYALLAAAFYGYPSEKLKVIGITGTNGKTSTAIFLKNIFDKCGIKSGLIGTVKNMIGDVEIPSTLTTPEYCDLQRLFADMVAAGCEYCIMEVSSQALAQRRVAGTRFALGLFTNLTQDHLDYHGTMENYASAKAELFRMCDVGIVNSDDSYCEYMTRNATCVIRTFGVTDEADYRASDVRLFNDKIEYNLTYPKGKMEMSLPVPGDFTVYNSLGALALAVECGVDAEKLREIVSKLEGVKGRIEVVPTDTEYTVIIDYAHTPDGLENILTAVRKFAEGRILTVFGCGGDRDRTKRPLMGKIAAEKSDIAFVTSDNPRSENPDKIIEDILEGIEDRSNVRVNPDRRSAIGDAMREAKKGDIVLLAGKGHETYQILSTGKIHFDEREVVQSIASIR